MYKYKDNPSNSVFAVSAVFSQGQGKYFRVEKNLHCRIPSQYTGKDSKADKTCFHNSVAAVIFLVAGLPLCK